MTFKNRIPAEADEIGAEGQNKWKAQCN